MRKPKVFLFDEPLSNLDAKMRVSTRAEISKLHARLGATMIYVTHDQVEAMTMGDRICVMKDGEIMQVAAPLELYQRPANLFVAGFIGSPPMNLFRGTIRHDGKTPLFAADGGESSSWSLSLPPALAATAERHSGRAVVFGIRPENVSLAPTGSATGIASTVEISEPMGAETYVHLIAAGTPFVARIAAGPVPHPAQPVRVTFDLGQAHLFDGVTETRL